MSVLYLKCLWVSASLSLIIPLCAASLPFNPARSLIAAGLPPALCRREWLLSYKLNTTGGQLMCSFVFESLFLSLLFLAHNTHTAWTNKVFYTANFSYHYIPITWNNIAHISKTLNLRKDKSLKCLSVLCTIVMNINIVEILVVENRATVEWGKDCELIIGVFVSWCFMKHTNKHIISSQIFLFGV